MSEHLRISVVFDCNCSNFSTIHDSWTIKVLKPALPTLSDGKFTSNKLCTSILCDIYSPHNISRDFIGRYSQLTNMARQVVRRMIDIGANLTDPMYQGIYNSKRKHESDYSNVMIRAKENAVEKIIITGGNLSESQKAISLSKEYDNLYSTVGCHPTRCKEFEDHESGPEDYLKSLEDLISSSKSKVVAVGEIGLDYDRLHFCPKEIQQRYFEMQLTLAKNTRLPLFLHNRASSNDFFDILHRNRDKFQKGVVHSFDGTKEDVNKIIDLGLHIGINGCSLKTEANIEVVSNIPRELLMIETGNSTD